MKKHKPLRGQKKKSVNTNQFSILTTIQENKRRELINSFIESMNGMKPKLKFIYK
ncbi:hypothetical protein [Aquimarina latercula]|uniref:hypothetical protein n=1 Tax=Aquimarina latercula TaxID=987 RepID=UPI0003F86A3F|nr:hypothetical protein [Aquimarina latercula]